jgi:hypothetical protein
MIYKAISFIQRKLNDIVGTATANIGEIIAADADIPREALIIISLVNVEENRISRDPRNYQRSGTDLLLKNPPVHLNLTLLFTAIRKNEMGYDSSLINLQAVIEFFQKQYVFDHANSSDLDPGIEKLILEMVSINMEQLNQLWSVMGGRYQPSVIYKMRMVTIDSVTDKGGGIIKEIESNFYSIEDQDGDSKVII